MSIATQLPAVPAATGLRLPTVDVVVPVHSEQGVLTGSIRRLHDYLSEMPFAWRIVITDSGSTDHTLRIAMALSEDLPGVEVIALPEKGRGRALRAAWERSNADVVCYMDADLSTDLRALPPLLAPLFSGHSEVAIGTRLSPGARVVRSAKRELISRVYNRLLRMVLGARFSDAQCGFKALRTSAARRLLPVVRDESWFFDTELLVAAQRQGLRVHEVPVDWVEDPDSSVHVVATALEDLRGVARLLSEVRLSRFLAVGVASTIAYALLYLLLREAVGPAGANALALSVTAVANTHANRRFTFGISERWALLRQHVMGVPIYLVTLGATMGALAALHQLEPDPSRALETALLAATSLCATAVRYLALRSWVFAGHRPCQRQAA